MNKITHFFWFCAGVQRETLEKFPEEQHKYVGIGATIFFTALFATLSGGYAMYFVFSGSAFAIFFAALFGMLWGLAIFNMDRYIVSTLNKNKAGWMQFLQALPRIVLAILIGLVISRPLELKIFDKEIRQHLQGQYLQQQKARIDTLENTFNKKYNLSIGQLTQQKRERDSLDTYIQNSRKQLNYEIFGNKTTETSGIQGYGPYAKRKEDELTKQQQYLDSLRARIDSQESAIQQHKKNEGLLDQKILANASLDSLVDLAGFADRNSALGRLKYKSNNTIDTATENAVNFIGLLFIFFECLPVFVKLMAGRDSYDIEIQNIRKIKQHESEMMVTAETQAIDRLEGAQIDIAINQRMEKLTAKKEED
ncbi:DUF4407 domain-containing protein [Sphingobacteriaceae bacterium WQ 2009]|uniref:DUF4407 domain-containing protein n=1 Tax=Rhinopithecimicrobium faecis TaxID=2820698 RepID=A0A8T4HAY7_9SPHI|nr:DUF4407 domain-containing protein [Sphingobacteriaceae bacterium WQ 2009]